MDKGRDRIQNLNLYIFNLQNFNIEPHCTLQDEDI